MSDEVAARLIALRDQLEALPRYQLHVSLGCMEPFVKPFKTDPHETGAFIRASDLEGLITALQQDPQDPTTFQVQSRLALSQMHRAHLAERRVDELALENEELRKRLTENKDTA